MTFKQSAGINRRSSKQAVNGRLRQGRRTQITIKRVLAPLFSFAVLALIASHQNDLLQRFGAAAVLQTQQVVGYLLQVGIWLSAAYLVNRLIQVFVWDGIFIRTFGLKMPRLIRDVGSVIVFSIAISGIIAVVFKQSVAGIWAASGVLGLVVGLALRNIILDIFIGLAMNFDRSFSIGDFLLLPGNLVGRVLDINWRTTRLRTNENNTIVIPNGKMGEMVIVNFSMPDPQAEFELQFSLEHSVPTDRALRVLSAGVLATAGNGGILSDPEPKVRIKGVSNLGVDYKVKYWIDCSQVGPGKARHQVLKSVLDQLTHAGLTLSHAKQDVFVAPMPSRQLDERSTADRVELLSRGELFSSLEQEDLARLAEDMKRHVVKQGTRLITQGAPGESMFILMEGLLHVLIDFQGSGAEMKVGQIQAGDFFGEMSLLTGEPRKATIVAATDVLAFEITKEQMQQLFSRRPEVAEAMSETVARRGLSNSQAYEQATAAERRQQHANLTAQIMGKVMSFFHTAFSSRDSEKEPLTIAATRA